MSKLPCVPPMAISAMLDVTIIASNQLDASLKYRDGPAPATGVTGHNNGTHRVSKVPGPFHNPPSQRFDGQSSAQLLIHTPSPNSLMSISPANSVEKMTLAMLSTSTVDCGMP